MSSKFDGAMYFDGSDDYLTVPNSTDWDFGSGDFTIDVWVNSTDKGVGTWPQVFEQFESGTERMYLRIERQGSWNRYEFEINTGGQVIEVASDSAPNYGAWQHLAVVRNGSEITMYVDGVAQADVETTSITIPNFNSHLEIGNYQSGTVNTNGVWNGYMDELRITKGETLWTSDFSASLPTEPGTADANTKLLLHFDGDESDSKHPVTFNGNAQMVSGGEFDGAYSFDGTGDYLTIPDSDNWDVASSFDYTIDLWVKHNDHAGTEVYAAHYGDPASYWWLHHSDGNGLKFSAWDSNTEVVST